MTYQQFSTILFGMAENPEAFLQARTRDQDLLTWYRFMRVLRKITILMDEALRDQDLSRSQLDLLFQVAFEDGINQQICAERMQVTKGNISQHIARLEKRGLIRRSKEGRDNYLSLTAAGSDLVVAILPVHDLQARKILSVLSPNELRQFQSILRKFDQKLE